MDESLGVRKITDHMGWRPSISFCMFRQVFYSAAKNVEKLLYELNKNSMIRSQNYETVD